MTLFLLHFPVSLLSVFIHPCSLTSNINMGHTFSSLPNSMCYSLVPFIALFTSLCFCLSICSSPTLIGTISVGAQILPSLLVCFWQAVLSQCFLSIDQIQVRSCCLISLYVSLGCQNAKEFNQVAAGLNLTKVVKGLRWRGCEWASVEESVKWELRVEWIKGKTDLMVNGLESVLKRFHCYYKSKLTVKSGIGSTYGGWEIEPLLC